MDIHDICNYVCICVGPPGVNYNGKHPMFELVLIMTVLIF